MLDYETAYLHGLGFTFLSLTRVDLTGVVDPTTGSDNP
jgi:hypothetical protein